MKYNFCKTNQLEIDGFISKLESKKSAIEEKYESSAEPIEVFIFRKLVIFYLLFALSLLLVFFIKNALLVISFSLLLGLIHALLFSKKKHACEIYSDLESMLEGSERIRDAVIISEILEEGAADCIITYGKNSDSISFSVKQDGKYKEFFSIYEDTAVYKSESDCTGEEVDFTYYDERFEYFKKEFDEICDKIKKKKLLK